MNLRIGDMPLRRRLFLANFLMVVIPVALLFLLGTGIFAVFQFSGIVPPRALAILWPEKGPELLVQFSAASLRDKAERKDGFRLKDIAEDCALLEDMGVRVLIEKEGRLVYASPGAAALQRGENGTSSQAAWQDEDFTFRYTAKNNPIRIIAAGTVREGEFLGLTGKRIRQGAEVIFIIIIGLAIIQIIAVGIYLSRLLSDQILNPLAALQDATVEICRGNLNQPLPAAAQDEIGAVCKDFEQMRLKLLEAQQRQETYEENRKIMIAGISHDLATPLTSLKGYASGILDGIAKTEEKRRHYVEKIVQSACTLEKLVESLSVFSKLDLGQTAFCLVPVSLRDYFADYVGERREALAEKGLLLSLRNTDESVTVQIDRVQFERLVDNILSNSLKYKQAEFVHVEIAVTRKGEDVVLTFADDGVGVAAEELPALFDTFYRTDAARSNVAKGSGLGLAIVRQITEAMGGRVRAERSVAGGLAIVVVLPLEKGEA